jgi:hypothetical protein
MPLEFLMINKCVTLLIALATVIPTAAALQQPEHLKLLVPEKIEIPDSGVTVPMLELDGRPMVEVMLNGKGPYPFLLDTGASLVEMNDDLQAELGLPTMPNAPSGVTRLAELRVSGTVLRGLAVVSFPHMPGLAGQNPPRGVLGASLFSGCVLTLDYPAKKILIRKGALPLADNHRVFQYDPEDVLPRIPIRIAGHECRPHLDSGSPGGLTLPVNSSSDLPLTGKPVQIGVARTPGGEFPVFSANLKEPIHIGEYTLQTREITFSDIRPGPEPPLGNIGYEVLREFVVALDAKNHRLQLNR